MRETFKDGTARERAEGRHGDEKMRLGWPETDAKEAALTQQLASNFSRLSLSHPLASRSLIFVLGGTNSRVKQPLFYDRYTFSFPSVDDISRSPNKRDSGFSEHLSCLHRRE